MVSLAADIFCRRTRLNLDNCVTSMQINDLNSQIFLDSQPIQATQSISTRLPFGSADTSTHALAGLMPDWKNLE